MCCGSGLSVPVDIVPDERPPDSGLIEETSSEEAMEEST